ncbi:MAG: sulfotransferase [Thermodesulfobacteriota bacterium]|nr:sulfotransferase [Thermodesulfobacteriota bacterium]
MTATAQGTMKLPNTKANIFFLVGFPRSGTTWFSNLLNSNQKIIYRHEIIGRDYEIFGKSLFAALKYNNGLSDEEYYKVITHISEARVDTDKPPFFFKPTGFLRYKHFHYYMWLLAKFAPIFQKVYKILFSIKKLDNLYFLIKETRSTQNLASIIAGLRPAAILFLVRQPHGSIASHIKGIEKGTMKDISINKKVAWYCSNQNTSYIKEIGLTEEQVTNMTNAEYLALHWRIYHDDLLIISQRLSNAHFISYEDCVENTEFHVKALFMILGLKFNKRVNDFINESSGKEKKNLIHRDASDDYYSVYRKESFNHRSWMTELMPEDIKSIHKHTDSTYEAIKLLVPKSCNQMTT